MSFIYKTKKNILIFFKNIDYILLFSIIILMTFGLLSMSSLAPSDNIFSRQLIILLISISAFLTFSTFDYRALKNSYILITLYTILIFALILIFAIGHISKGGNRWFNLGSFLIGPSEPMKIVLILILAKFLPLCSKIYRRKLTSL